MREKRVKEEKKKEQERDGHSVTPDQLGKTKRRNRMQKAERSEIRRLGSNKRLPNILTENGDKERELPLLWHPQCVSRVFEQE